MYCNYCYYLYTCPYGRHLVHNEYLMNLYERQEPTPFPNVPPPTGMPPASGNIMQPPIQLPSPAPSAIPSPVPSPVPTPTPQTGGDIREILYTCVGQIVYLELKNGKRGRFFIISYQKSEDVVTGAPIKGKGTTINVNTIPIDMILYVKSCTVT